MEIRGSRVEGQEPDANAPPAHGKSGGGSAWPLIVLLVLAAVTLLWLQLRRPKPIDPLVGQPLPPLDAAGWLDTDRPLSAEDLRGKFVVIDFFASWCGPCARGLPDLVQFRDRYRDRGLVVVGLSGEPASSLDQIERFIHRVEGADWPVAYGATLAYQVTGINALPTYVLYDRSGVSVWAGWSVDGLDDAMVAELAKK